MQRDLYDIDIVLDHGSWVIRRLDMHDQSKIQYWSQYRCWIDHPEQARRYACKLKAKYHMEQFQ